MATVDGMGCRRIVAARRAAVARVCGGGSGGRRGGVRGRDDMVGKGGTKASISCGGMGCAVAVHVDVPMTR